MSRNLYIAGVSVSFPCQPYPAQLNIMSKLISAARRGEHSLIESPTGTGKTLALLCSSLAFQKFEEGRLQALFAKQMDNYMKLLDTLNQKKEARVAGPSVSQKKAPHRRARVAKTRPPGGGNDRGEDDGDDDFRPAASNTRKRKRRIRRRRKGPTRGPDCKEDMPMGPSTSEPQANRIVPRGLKRKEGMPLDPSTPKHQTLEPRDLNCGEATPSISHPSPPSLQPQLSMVFSTPSLSENVPQPTLEEAPKIYFCTRTHSQIQQVISELKKTTYSEGLRMTTLSSRQIACINSKVVRNKHKSVNEGCKELLEQQILGSGPGCSYNGKKKMHRLVTSMRTPPVVHDIEDLVAAGKKKKCCPYYASRELAVKAQIVFCPYNYIVDEKIRESLGIVLTNSLLIFDEGHNIEDVSCSTASTTIDMDDLNNTIADLENLCHDPDYNVLHGLVVGLSSFLSITRLRTVGFEEAQKKFRGSELIIALEDIGVVEDKKVVAKKCLLAIKKKSEDGVIELASSSLIVVENLISVCHFFVHLLPFPISLPPPFFQLASHPIQINLKVLNNILKEELRFMSDYWVVLSKGPRNTSVSFYCMNPAVAFSEIKKECRSICISSGTLTPLDSFSSELDIHFRHNVSCRHVIEPSRLFVRALCTTTCNFKNSQKFEFLDEIGCGCQ